MKRGAKQALGFSIILVLSLSIVSAFSVGDLIQSIFPFPGFTGKATVSNECIDSDGPNNFLTAGNVEYAGLNYYDYCDGDTNYDYDCEGTPGQASEGLIDINLPLLRPTLTGFVVGDEPHKAYLNCMDAYGVSCINTAEGGLCGCEDGSTQTCGPTQGNTGECSLGEATCNGGSYGDCVGAIYPRTETCDGKDNDCDGEIDEGSSICPSGQVCTEGGCVGGSCTPGVTQSCNTGLLGICAGGQQTCTSQSFWGNCQQINEATTEICDDLKDNDCDGKIDCDDTSCSTDSACTTCTPKTCDDLGFTCGAASDGCGRTLNCGTCDSGETCQSNVCVASTDCTDSDGDGYSIEGGDCGDIDCDDTDDTIYPGEVQICGPTDVSLSGNSICKKGEKTCQSDGTYSQCIGAVNPTDEILDNGLDDDCDGSTDEGGVCTNGDTKDCSSGCDTKEQTCEDGTWGACTLISTDEECNTDSVCEPGDLDVCSTNKGECQTGLITCQSDGTWGTDCDGGILPVTEICGDVKDNDCDGLTDEDCSTTTETPQNDEGTTNVQPGTTNEDETNQESTKTTGKSFFQKLWDLIASIFNVGRGIMGYTIETPTKLCSDSDGGKNYFQKGTGSGLTQNNEEIWVSDFCYTDSQNDRTDKCGGGNCYLQEYYCDGKYIKTEEAAICQYGCANGACIPDASLSDSCKKFNKQTWEWENIC